MRHFNQVSHLIHACQHAPRLVEEANAIITQIMIGNYRGDLQTSTITDFLRIFREIAEHEHIHLQSMNDDVLYGIIRHISGCRDFT